jgi:hypothetical protein
MEHLMSVTEHGKADDKGGDKQTIKLTIGTPKGSFTAEFAKTAKVTDVIAAAIKAKELDGGTDSFEVFLGDKQLTPVDRPLVSFGVKDGDTLLLAATGSGV